MHLYSSHPVQSSGPASGTMPVSVKSLCPIADEDRERSSTAMATLFCIGINHECAGLDGIRRFLYGVAARALNARILDVPRGYCPAFTF